MLVNDYKTKELVHGYQAAEKNKICEQKYEVECN